MGTGGGVEESDADLLPEFVVLLEEAERTGLEAPQEDLELLLQFGRLARFRCHVTAVHLRGTQYTMPSAHQFGSH